MMKMKWIMTIVFISTILTGCYVPHPGNKVGVEHRRVHYTEVCTYNQQASAWYCTRTRRWAR